MSADLPPPPPVPPDPTLNISPSDRPAQAKRKRRGRQIAAIIGVILFIGMIVIVYNAAMKAMRNAQARELAVSIVIACKGYHGEYGRYPLPEDGTAGEVSPLRTDEILTGTLLGANTQANPKKISFLPELRPVERGSGFGLRVEEDPSTIVDPWGEEYYVLMDADSSGTIENPNAAASEPQLHQGAIVWSAGQDMDPSTWEDNVMSWDNGKSSRSPAVPKATK